MKTAINQTIQQTGHIPPKDLRINSLRIKVKSGQIRVNNALIGEAGAAENSNVSSLFLPLVHVQPL